MSDTARSPVGPLRAKRVICTLGMHRSGTSVVSRMLNLLGVYLGTHQSISDTREDNPRGHWEHYPLVLLNDEILARFGGRWDEPPAFPPSWPRDPRLGDVREKARQLLTEDFAAEPVWGWKDPRTCLTIPFWQDLVGSIRYVMCVRNPCAVVASLSRRDGMSSEKAERLWLAHVQSSLAHTSGQPRMFVFYEDIINDYALELRRMAAFIGRPDRGEDPCVHASVGEFLEKELCHHRVSMEDLADNQRISFATKGLYLALRGLAPRDTPVDAAFSLDRAGRSAQTTLDLLGARALETWDRTAAVAAECHELAMTEKRLLQSMARLESDLRGVTLERDVQALAPRTACLPRHGLRGGHAPSGSSCSIATPSSWTSWNCLRRPTSQCGP